MADWLFVAGSVPVSKAFLNRSSFQMGRMKDDGKLSEEPTVSISRRLAPVN